MGVLYEKLPIWLPTMKGVGSSTLSALGMAALRHTCTPSRNMLSVAVPLAKLYVNAQWCHELMSAPYVLPVVHVLPPPRSSTM